MLPTAPEPLNHPRAPLQALLNIFQRFRPHPHPGERKKSSPRAGYIKMIAHPVDQSKSLASFLKALWSRLPGDPAILAFLQPGRRLQKRNKIANLKYAQAQNCRRPTRSPCTQIYFRLRKRYWRFWPDYNQTKSGAWVPGWEMDDDYSVMMI